MGFEYKYPECVKKFLGMCREEIIKTDYYDLSDPVMRKQLIDMGFVLVVRDKVLQ